MDFPKKQVRLSKHLWLKAIKICDYLINHPDNYLEFYFEYETLKERIKILPDKVYLKIDWLFYDIYLHHFLRMIYDNGWDTKRFKVDKRKYNLFKKDMYNLKKINKY
jgi:hypothetical protein